MIMSYIDDFRDGNVAERQYSFSGEVYRQFTKYLYQQNLLVKGRWVDGIVNLKTSPPKRNLSSRDDLLPWQSLFNDLSP